MRAFQYENPVISFLTRVANIMLVGLFWLICSVPVITIVPASAALFHTTTKVVYGSGSGIMRDFFKTFAGSLRQGLILSVFCVASGFALSAGLYLGYQLWDGTSFGIAQLVLGLFLCYVWSSVVLFLPPVLSRFEGKAGSILQLSFYLVFRNAGRALLLVLLLLVFVIGLMVYPLLLFLVPGTYAAAGRPIMEKILTSYMRERGIMPEEEKPAESENENEEETEDE